MKSLLCLLLLATMAVCLVQCTNEKDTLEKGSNHSDVPVLPAQAFQYYPDSGSANNIATLGRVLFYDNMLSISNSVACADCHKQAYAFSDNKPFSNGFANELTLRNAPPIMNTASMTRFFWDMRESTLASLSLKPIQNHIEMGFEKMDQLIPKLKASPYYSGLFNKAYSSTEITAEKIAQALSMFLGSMDSHNSKYDKGTKINFGNFTTEELAGKALFMDRLHCASCHSGEEFRPGNEWFGGLAAANIGLDEQYKDKGITDPELLSIIFSETGLPEGYFKIPTLRNVELTAPYMHDGRFATLEAVVEHYNSGVAPHKNLSWQLRNIRDKNGKPVIINPNTSPRLGLDDTEKKALVAFLKTLTDPSYITEVKYSDPFYVSSK